MLGCTARPVNQRLKIAGCPRRLGVSLCSDPASGDGVQPPINDPRNEPRTSVAPVAFSWVIIVRPLVHMRDSVRFLKARNSLRYDQTSPGASPHWPPDSPPDEVCQHTPNWRVLPPSCTQILALSRPRKNGIPPQRSDIQQRHASVGQAWASRPRRSRGLLAEAPRNGDYDVRLGSDLPDQDLLNLPGYLRCGVPLASGRPQRRGDLSVGRPDGNGPFGRPTTSEHVPGPPILRLNAGPVRTADTLCCTPRQTKANQP